MLTAMVRVDPWQVEPERECAIRYYVSRIHGWEIRMGHVRVRICRVIDYIIVHPGHLCPRTYLDVSGVLLIVHDMDGHVLLAPPVGIRCGESPVD